ncbi:hypothetical protein SAMN05443634_1236 [Chishuiella changwenlii]|uniref:Uncharacterized protein n=1 Tax=Chishuiella changwenlii TaxID=1434701 RepID=A0A1M7DAM1_9FLAO|nr:hypothetical protein [Chishuiella changwenlii]GGF11667.1 hypothetical protein GCM10010984_30850 [Chishuiella changwenlii]SHL76561.1 hypothetical protein SAMN05443634_1236 [Chishuiella changwenlii]
MKKIVFIFILILSFFCYSQENKKKLISEQSEQISKASLRKLAFTDCFYAKYSNPKEINDREFAHYNLFGFEPFTIKEQRDPISKIIDFATNWGKTRKQNLDISPIINCLELYESKELDILIDSAFLHVNEDELNEYFNDPEFKYIGTYKYYLEKK